MRQSSIRPSNRPRRPTKRGRRAFGEPTAADAAILDDGWPAEKRTGYQEIGAGQASRSYDGIVVVVGKTAISRPELSRLPGLHAKASRTQALVEPVAALRRAYGARTQALVEPVAALKRAYGARTQALAEPVAALKRAYGAIFSPDERHFGDETDGDGLKAHLTRTFENQRKTGSRVLAIALAVGGGWATLVPLSGAVVIPGTVVAETNVKKIQHPTGGIVAGISVTDGTHVQEGDSLVRLDDTQVRSNFQVVSNQLEEIKARIARLTAERDGRDDQPLIRKATFQHGAADDQQLMASEGTLFEARTNARRSQRELLRSRIAQSKEEIVGLEAQVKSNQTQSDLIAQELEAITSLYEKHLTPLTRLTSLQREAARLEGDHGQLVSKIAETRSKVNEAELQLIKLDQDFRADVMKDLREAQDKEAELTEREVAARDQVAHIDLRAPVTGIVHQLAVHTIGGVVTPAEVMMVIVPESDELQIDARLPPTEIDQVHKGQNTRVRFPAFNQRTTPELSGIVSQVSADVTKDPQSNASYYTVRVSLPGKEFARLGEQHLIAGMPAEIFIQTGSRSMVSYLFKPISDQLHRMFRER